MVSSCSTDFFIVSMACRFSFSSGWYFANLTASFILNTCASAVKSAAGKLNWTAPAGKWNLYALFMGWHGKQVERAAPGGEGNVIDHFSASALQHYLNKFDVAFKGQDISGLRGYFNDSYEVDDARGQSNYTPLLFQEFKKRRGYDLKTELPALFTKKSTERTNRILCDYRMTIDELILEKFTGGWATWAHKKGKIVLEAKYDKAFRFVDGLAIVRVGDFKKGKFGYIDKTGKMVIQAIHDQAFNFMDGLACVRQGDPKSGKWGYIDKTGKVVIANQYDFPSDFKNGLAYVRLGNFKNKTAYIDKKGNVIWQQN